MKDSKSSVKAKKVMTDNKRRAVKKKEELKPEVIVQHAGNETNLEQIIDRIKELYVKDGHYLASVKSLKVYVKPEENAAYYVINQKISGKIDLF